MAEEQTQLVETPKEKLPKIKLNSQLPLSSQLNRLNSLLTPKETSKEAPKAEEPAKEDPKEEPKDEPVVPVPPIDEPVDEPIPPAVELGPIGKYVYDKLPTLMVRIKDGEGTKIVSYKDTNELPVGFELADSAEIAKFTSDVAAQTGRAKDLIGEYKQTELNNNITKYQEQENQDVASALERLQKAEILDKFQYPEDDPRFNDDPAVKVSNEIYAIFKTTNDNYRKQNKTYRITYEDAADKYFARQARVKPDDSQKGKEQPAPPKKDKTAVQKEREQVAKQVGAPAGGEPTSKKPGYKSGMTMSDINRLVRAGKI